MINSIRIKGILLLYKFKNEKSPFYPIDEKPKNPKKAWIHRVSITLENPTKVNGKTEKR